MNRLATEAGEPKLLNTAKLIRENKALWLPRLETYAKSVLTQQ